MFLCRLFHAGWFWLLSATAAGARDELSVASRAGSNDHTDPVAPILLVLVLMGLGAVLGGRWMRRIGQPAVLGELVVGMLLANLGYALHEPVTTVLRNDAAMVEVVQVALHEDISLSEAAHRVLPDPEGDRLAQTLTGPSGPLAVAIHHFVDLLSRIAVIVLLFLVGLETSVQEMRRVGWSSTLVAVLGVCAPLVLGFVAVAWLNPQARLADAVFIGAILTATSVGITARVFRDLRQSRRPEAKIILGAAVIDDVLGLILLAVVSGLVVTGTVSFAVVSVITLKALGFLVGAIGLGTWLTPRLVRLLARTEIENVKLFFGLGFAFFLSWVANQFGLATIVGAFAAGLVLEEFFLNELKGHSLRDLLSPLESLIVPIFFVFMGMQVKLETLTDGRVVLLAVVLTAVAIVGKLVSGLACPRTLDRLSVGVGMMPRGEVGLIFASIGKGLGVVTDAIFSAVVIMVMVTTFLTPPLLKITLARSQSRATAA
ncbi:MAG: cation:proton antiporter [Acidobacteriia bacterium]|jgi:Kef-type K+ transport system membrane component KefB|nr:cation:proton antiporter [Terriglobia bacterium]